ncbi:hypothetical protein Nepgr_031690 [Nepenthes gracilis]|uniref:Uncharacterized protein n=1 Tax=Nepenthes gracilis TaxID=150966 RepID=A0AAD3Y516_NEPGR|nr:hypothetical protein Nepgr_031690 [Nepenthes gracilis]
MEKCEFTRKENMFLCRGEPMPMRIDLGKDGHSIEFDSWKLNDVKQSSSAHAKEMPVVVHCLQVWMPRVLVKYNFIWEDKLHHDNLFSGALSQKEV